MDKLVQTFVSLELSSTMLGIHKARWTEMRYNRISYYDEKKIMIELKKKKKSISKHSLIGPFTLLNLCWFLQIHHMVGCMANLWHDFAGIDNLQR